MYVLVLYVNNSRVITDKRARVNFECLNFSNTKTIEPDDAVSGESLFLFWLFIYKIYSITAMLVIIFAYIMRHICISKRWGSKLPLMKAAKVNINKRILSTLWFFLHCSICPPYGEIKNCGIPAWYQYNGRNLMTLQKCRSFCVLN